MQSLYRYAQLLRVDRNENHPSVPQSPKRSAPKWKTSELQCLPQEEKTRGTFLLNIPLWKSYPALPSNSRRRTMGIRGKVEERSRMSGGWKTKPRQGNESLARKRSRWSSLAGVWPAGSGEQEIRELFPFFPYISYACSVRRNVLSPAAVVEPESMTSISCQINHASSERVWRGGVRHSVFSFVNLDFGCTSTDVVTLLERLQKTANCSWVCWASNKRTRTSDSCFYLTAASRNALFFVDPTVRVKVSPSWNIRM